MKIVSNVVDTRKLLGGPFSASFLFVEFKGPGAGEGLDTTDDIVLEIEFSSFVRSGFIIIMLLVSVDAVADCHNLNFNPPRGGYFKVAFDDIVFSQADVVMDTTVAGELGDEIFGSLRRFRWSFSQIMMNLSSKSLTCDRDLWHPDKQHER
jgi:hypothetical protein